MPKNDYGPTIAREVQRAGGYEQLAKRLGVKAGDVQAWAAGSRPPPPRVLLRLADLMLQDTQAGRPAGSVGGRNP